MVKVADKHRRRLQGAPARRRRIELKRRAEAAEMGWEEMRLLSRPDRVAFPYTRACMNNLILDRGIYIYSQTKHIA